jgi:hypothetical protein
LKLKILGLWSDRKKGHDDDDGNSFLNFELIEFFVELLIAFGKK